MHIVYNDLSSDIDVNSVKVNMKQKIVESRKLRVRNTCVDVLPLRFRVTGI